MAKRSAFEKLNRKLEGEGEGDVNITVIVDADADAVEEALDQEALDTEVSKGETTADLEEASQEEAAELSAIVGVLRQHGLNEGMHALLVASGKFAMHRITAPGKESLSATDRNTAAAEQLAAAFEKSESTFWESTKKFFKDMWDRIIRVYNWIVTKVGSIRGRCERAHDSLKGKIIDPDKIKDAKTNDAPNIDSHAKAQETMVDLLKQVIAGLAMRDPNAEIKVTISEAIPSDILKSATGYTYDGKTKDKLGEQNKDFLKPKEKAITKDSVNEYENTRWTTVNKVLAAMSKVNVLESGAKDAQKVTESLSKIDSAENKASGGTGSTSAQKENLAKMRSNMSILMQISGKFTQSMGTICKLYITNCAKVRACCKAGD